MSDSDSDNGRGVLDTDDIAAIVAKFHAARPADRAHLVTSLRINKSELAVVMERFSDADINSARSIARGLEDDIQDGTSQTAATSQVGAAKQNTTLNTGPISRQTPEPGVTDDEIFAALFETSAEVASRVVAQAQAQIFGGELERDSLQQTLAYAEQERVDPEKQSSAHQELMIKVGRLLASYAGCDVAQPGWGHFASISLVATLEAPVTAPHRFFIVGQPWVVGGEDHVVLADSVPVHVLLARLYGRAQVGDCGSGTIVELAELTKLLSSTNDAVPATLVSFVLFVWVTQVDSLTDSVWCAVRGLLVLFQERWQVDREKLSKATRWLFQQSAAQRPDVRLVAQILTPDGTDSLIQQTSTISKVGYVDLNAICGVEADESIKAWYWPSQKVVAILLEADHVWLFDEVAMAVRKIVKELGRLDLTILRYSGPGNQVVELDMIHSGRVLFQL